MYANPPPPAKPQLCLQIGFSGHRPNGLQQIDLNLLQAKISEVLAQIHTEYQKLAGAAAAKQLYDETDALPPRMLNALAEGADRLTAQAALQQHYQLHCPLPFPREVYATDFEYNPQSLAEYQALLDQAERVLELDGDRTQPEQAYRNAGLLMVNHADILLTVWDGVENRHSAGTAGMVYAAQQLRKPLIWINPDSLDQIQIYDPRTKAPSWQAYNTETLRKLLNDQLLYLGKVEAETEVGETCTLWLRWQNHCRRKQQSRRIYLCHPEPRPNVLGIVYRSLFSILGKHSLSGIIDNNYRQDALSQWHSIIAAKSPQTSDQSMASQPKTSLAIALSTGQHFVHADSLASYYADRYRGAFVLSFALGALAVGFAQLGAPTALAATAKDHTYAVLEFLTILSIAGLIHGGRYAALHQRWLDFRLLAECLRQHAFLAPIGAIGRWSRPAYHNHDDAAISWINWLLRGLIRAEGLPQISFERGYRQLYQQFLLAMLNDQAEYHAGNAKRNHRIAHSLHLLNSLLLVSILFICVWHFLLNPIDSAAERLELVLSILSGLLPAAGAALAGILSQGEFQRIAERSQSMAAYLTDFAESLGCETDLSVAELARQAQQIIELLSQELFDWRVIFRSKPLEHHA